MNYWCLTVACWTPNPKVGVRILCGLPKEQMKKIAFVVMILMTFGYGCVKDTNLVVEELNKKRDNSTLEQLVETPIEIDVYKEGWTDEQRGFWASNYWAMLAGNPQTRARFEPLSVYKIATCIVDTWARDKSLQDFEISK